MPEAELSLNHFSDAASLQHGTAALDKMLNMLRNRKMPPKDEVRPTEDEYRQVSAWLDAYTTKAALWAPKNPGRVTLHRLNRPEYNNTIRDLLAIDFKPADAFPIDDAGYGFDNNGDVLSIAPVLMEKYIDAAGQSLDRAIFADPIVPAPVKHWDAMTMAGTIPTSDPKTNVVVLPGPSGRTVVNGRVFNYNGEIHADYNFPKDGQYVLRLRGYGQQRPMVQFKLDGVNAGAPIAVTESQADISVYATAKLRVTAGTHQVMLVFTNGATKEEYDAAQARNAAAATRPAAVAGAATQPSAGQAAGAGGAAANPGRARGPGQGVAGAQGGRAGAAGRAAGRPPRGGTPGGAGTGRPMLGVDFVEVEGPDDITPERMPESYRKVMVAQPSATVTKAQAAELIIRNFASKAYRRPVDDGEFKRLMGLWSQQDAAGEAFEDSIHTTLQAVLVSPYFLYRYERDPGPNDPGGVRTIDEYELASRLSYFLWSSMPDEELLKLAGDGQLRANLPAQVKRMMADPKAFAMVENFAGQWLQLRQMATVSPDPKRFPDFDEPLRQAMVKETQLFFSAVMTEDRSVLDFIDANFTFMNARLAKHYGVSGVTGDQFRRVVLSGDERGGLITQASILTLTSYTNRTSPVLRGKWVLENLLDEAPPPPPPDVPKLAETEQAELTGTLRQRMEQHRANPNCVTCHAQMDPIGFGLENFDAIGAWRIQDLNNVAIDSSGTLPDGTAFQGAKGLKQILLAQKDQFCRCLANRMTTYALGRGMESYDKPMLDQIAAGLKENDYKFSALVMRIVQSDAFQKRGSSGSDNSK
jgi:hypothetical protein